jgi:hypothetical protein
MGFGLLGALAGCSTSPGEDLFPLERGHRWTYRVVSEWENQTRETETLVLSNEGEDRQLSSGAAWRRHSDAGVDYWLRKDAGGVYRVASKSDLDADPQPDPAPRFVLKAPIAVGTQWQATTTAYLLRRRNEFPPEIRHSHPAVPMTYVVEAVGVGVDTPAGHFDRCVQVKGTAQIKLFADPVVGWQMMPLTTVESYCPGVGLVRVERREPASSTFLLGGSQVMELQAWE